MTLRTAHSVCEKVKRKKRKERREIVVGGIYIIDYVGVCVCVRAKVPMTSKRRQPIDRSLGRFLFGFLSPSKRPRERDARRDSVCARKWLGDLLCCLLMS